MDLSLDPKVTALVLIDLQRGIVGRQAARMRRRMWCAMA